MSETRAAYAVNKTYTATQPAQIIEPLTLIDPEEVNLVLRYRQAKAQGATLVINADCGELRMLGRVERLRRRAY